MDRKLVFHFGNIMVLVYLGGWDFYLLCFGVACVAFCFKPAHAGQSHSRRAECPEVMATPAHAGQSQPQLIDRPEIAPILL